MRLVLIGPPGSGKGTQAAVLCEEHGVPHISTGDLLRDQVDRGTALGREAAPALKDGALVPDGLITAAVRERLAAPDCRRGFLLDGYPRTVDQAESLAALLRGGSGGGRGLDAVVELDVPVNALVDRLQARGRADDTAPVIRHRQQVYREETAPLTDHYARSPVPLLRIPATGTPAEVATRIRQALNGTKPHP